MTNQADHGITVCKARTADGRIFDMRIPATKDSSEVLQDYGASILRPPTDRDFDEWLAVIRRDIEERGGIFRELNREERRRINKRGRA